MSDTNGVCGILLFPDAYLQPSTVAAPSTVNLSVAWSSSPNYTTDQWSAMETAGAIFIPAAGYRDGTTVTGANVNGAYWSSSVFNKGYAKSPTFYNAKVNFSNSPYRHYGRSVRLVRDRD